MVFNRNVLEARLNPGTYTLFFFEPVSQYYSDGQQLTICAPFDFMMHVTWVPNPTIKCNFPRSPPTLFDKQQKDVTVNDVIGELHFVAEYYLAPNIIMKLPVEKDSKLRIGLQSHHDVIISVSRTNKPWFMELPIRANEAASLANELVPGDYIVNITSLTATAYGNCPTYRIEAALLPKLQIRTLACTADNYEKSTLRPLTYLPYVHYDQTKFYAKLSGLNVGDSIWHWDFQVKVSVIFQVELVSHFLVSDLKMAIMWAENGRTETFHEFNYNSMHIIHNCRLGVILCTFTLHRMCMNHRNALNFQ